MDLKLVKKLLDLIGESDVDEVSIEEGDFKISVKKRAESEETPLIHYQMPPQPGTAPQAASQPIPPDGGKAEGETVTSPIVGTFYRASSPENAPFIEEGDRVEKGDPLCVIEAMKIMNEIEAEFSGTVTQILAQDAQPVEYDQPLFVIKKD